MRRFGKMGIDAASRIVGFFVAAMGVGLIFHGVIEALTAYVSNPVKMTYRGCSKNGGEGTSNSGTNV